jgi:hypothetical protein
LTLYIINALVWPRGSDCAGLSTDFKYPVLAEKGGTRASTKCRIQITILMSRDPLRRLIVATADVKLELVLPRAGNKRIIFKLEGQSEGPCRW